MESHIFISYSRVDEADVRDLYNHLVNKGVDCWLDVERIPSGSDWDNQLQKAIEDCSHFIVICTPSSMSSKNVLAEWQYAFDLKKSIHPIIMEPCEIPFRLRIYQHIDVTKLGLEEAVHKLVQSLPQSEYKTAEFDIGLETGISKVKALVARSVQNWRAFGLLLDQSAFHYIDSLRDDLDDLDVSTIEFLYLSVRKLKNQNTPNTLNYWAARVKQHSAACDSVENIIIDEISETTLNDSQAELEVFASLRLVAKLAQIINLTDDHLQISLLLDAAIRLLTKARIPFDDLTVLEDALYRKFQEQPNQIFARALGWLESPKMLNTIKVELARSQPGNLGEIDRLHLVCLANMQNPEAVSILEQFTPNDFCFIPAEWFLMGSKNEGIYFAPPEHEVFVPSFWLRKIPVTETEFKTGRLFSSQEVMRDFPAHNISWTSAMRWTNKVAQEMNLPLTLPTEAMWEKAASWDPNQKRKQAYPWGDERDFRRCNTIEGNRRVLTPVGTFSPDGDSPYGVSDMVGNVWEWTSSPMRPYPYQPRIEREPKVGEKQIMRGPLGEMRVMRGSSMDAHRGLHPGSVTRISFEENYAFSNAGMRVALVVDI